MCTKEKDTKQCLQKLHPQKCHLLPNGRLHLDPPLGSLQLPPALSLPLLAKLPPRVEGFLKEEKQAAANEVEQEWSKEEDTKISHFFPD